MKGHIDLTTSVGGFLTLSEPLWIASSHLTSTKQVVQAWADLRPAALTLKTSKRVPKPEPGKPTIREKLSPSVSQYGQSLYCDGPKDKEFLTYEATRELLDHALAQLKDTKIGVSVLADPEEDYEQLRELCGAAAFCELNLKYSFRPATAAGSGALLATLPNHYESVLAQIRRFSQAFAGSPVFVKLPRELAWLPDTDEQKELLRILEHHGKAGLIIANSLKQDLAPLLIDGREVTFRGGVLCGEFLFDSTLKLLAAFAEPCENRRIPLVASGGLIREEHVLLSLRAGAAAIQLCTTFDYHTTRFYSTLRSMLRSRVQQQGVPSFKAFRAQLPKLPTAALLAFPFTYYTDFWAPAAQAHLRADILTARRMDAFVMSGHSLVDRWRDGLRKRFEKNLGLRLFVPSPRSPILRSIQRAWKFGDPELLRARQARMAAAVRGFQRLWKDTKQTRVRVAKDEKPAELRIHRHGFVPFYSFYLFDDHAYVSPYTFTRTDRAVPVYVFFAGSAEYDRLAAELEEVAASSTVLKG